MNEKTQLLQVRLAPSVIAEVKELGKGKFALGLGILLYAYQQTTSKGSKPAKEEDPLHPGDTYQAKAKRAREAHANSPETKRKKIHAQLEQYIKHFYNLHRGIIDETTMFETQIFDAKGNHLVGAGEDIRIMDYITPDELDVWMPESVANYKANHALTTPLKPRIQTKQLTPEALLGYGFKRTPPDMPDEAIEAINAEWVPGGEHYGDDPIREMEK